MEKRVIYHTIIGTILSYLMIVLIYSIYIWNNVQDYHQFITRSLSYPSFLVIPLFVGLYIGIKNLQKEKSKKVLYKMPLGFVITLLIIAVPFFLLVLLTPCSGEGCIVTVIILSYIVTVQGLLTTISFLLLFVLYTFIISVLLYKYYNTRKLMRIILSMLILLIVINLIVIMASGWCTGEGDECRGKRAARLNDITICEKADVLHNCIKYMAVTSENESLCDNLLEMRGEIEYNECILFVALKKEDISLCEKTIPLESNKKVEDDGKPDAPNSEGFDCTGDWICSQFGPCINGIMKRTCVDCNASYEKPSEEASCIEEETIAYEKENCYRRYQNLKRI